MTPNTTKQLVARSTCSYVFRKSCFRSNRGSSGGATSHTESSQPYGAAEPVTEAAVAVCRWRPGEGVLISTKGGGVHLRRAIGAGMGCAVQGRAAAPRSCRRCSCCRFPSCWAGRDGPPGVSKPRKVVNRDQNRRSNLVLPGVTGAVGAMANKTAGDATTRHGTNPQYLVRQLRKREFIHRRESPSCFGLYPASSSFSWIVRLG